MSQSTYGDALGVLDAEWDSLCGLPKEEVVDYLLQLGFSEEVANIAVSSLNF